MLRREAGLDRASLPIKFINSAHFAAPSQNRSLGLASSRRKRSVQALENPSIPPLRLGPGPSSNPFQANRPCGIISPRLAPIHCGARSPLPTPRACFVPRCQWATPPTELGACQQRGGAGRVGRRERSQAHGCAGVGGGHGGDWNAGEGQEAAGAAGAVDAGACQRSREGEGCGRAAAGDGGFAIWVRTGRWAWRPQCRSGERGRRGSNDNSARGAHGHHHGADHRTLARGAQA